MEHVAMKANVTKHIVRTLPIITALAVASGLLGFASRVHAQSVGALALTGEQASPIDPRVSTSIPSARPAVNIDRAPMCSP
jgi:hypothetical protein